MKTERNDIKVADKNILQAFVVNFLLLFLVTVESLKW